MKRDLSFILTDVVALHHLWRYGDGANHGAVSTGANDQGRRSLTWLSPHASRTVAALADRLLVACVIVVVLLFVALGFFAMPSADDYCYAATLKEHGPWSAMATWYESWTGRYTATAAISLAILLTDLRTAYWIVPVIGLACLASGLYLLLRAIGSKSGGRTENLRATSLALAVFLALTPVPNETLYWMSGTFSYLLANGALLGLLALLIGASRGGRLLWYHAPLAAGMALAVVGLNETSLSLTLFCLAIGLAHDGWRRNPARRLWLVALLAAAAGALIVAAAPGNGVRIASFPHARELARTALQTPAHAAKAWADFLTSPTPWLAALVGARWAGRHRLAALLPATSSAVGHWLAIGAFCLLTLACLLPAEWAMGTSPPPRAYAVIVLVCLGGWFMAAVPLLLDGVRRIRLLPDSPRWLLPLAKVGLATSLVLVGNVPTVIGDLTGGDAWAFAAQRDDRRQCLERAARHGASTVQVGAMRRVPASLAALELSPRPDAWQNRCVGRFFGVQQVMLSDHIGDSERICDWSAADSGGRSAPP